MGKEVKELRDKSVEEWQKKSCQPQPKIEKKLVVVTADHPRK